MKKSNIRKVFSFIDYNFQMKQFIDTKNNTYTFSSCEICPAKCCDGRQGTVFAQIILEDFKTVYKNFPILFLFGELGYLKPIVLLTNGVGFCKYLKDFKCSIYEQRPSICRAYPLSPNVDDNIYIDEVCPAVNDKQNSSQTIISNSQISPAFDYKTLHNYQDKYIETHYEMENFNNKDDFSIVAIINGIEFYKCNKLYENEFMKMHQDSLAHLQDRYFTN